VKKSEAEKNVKKRGRGGSRFYFFGFMVLVYVGLFLFKLEAAKHALNASGVLLIKIIPVLLVVIFFMGILNFFLNPKTVSKHVGKESGVKGWLVAISAGILSHGSIYFWYPLLKQLREQGMRRGLIAVFLYNRAVKIPLLPVMIYYFGIKFTVVLLLYMIIFSIFEGKVIDAVDLEK